MAKNQALIAAAKANSPNAVKLALDSGADPNSRDNTGFSADWLETNPQALRRKQVLSNEPALAIAMDKHAAYIVAHNPLKHPRRPVHLADYRNSAADIIALLLQRGADRYIAQEWKATSVFPRDENAIHNGISLLRTWRAAPSAQASARLRSYIGKRVAFYGYWGPSRLQIDEDVNLNVDFVPAIPSSSPIVIESAVIGTVESINTQKRTIFIRAQYSDWIILASG